MYRNLHTFFTASVEDFAANKVGTLGKAIGLYSKLYERYITEYNNIDVLILPCSI